MEEHRDPGRGRAKVVEVKHPNGYSGKLYGRSSMVIYNPDGRWCLHCGHRTINTREELYQELETMPVFLAWLQDHADKRGENDETGRR